MGSRQRKVENVVQGVARALSSYIDGRRREMLDQLQRLVEIESPTDYRDGVNRVGDILAGELAALGMKVTRLPESDYGDHIVGDLERPGTVRVLLLGTWTRCTPWERDGLSAWRATGPTVRASST